MLLSKHSTTFALAKRNKGKTGIYETYMPKVSMEQIVHCYKSTETTVKLKTKFNWNNGYTNC